MMKIRGIAGASGTLQMAGGATWRNKFWYNEKIQSVTPALVKLVQTSENIVAKFHALWALEGIGALESSLVKN